MFHPTLGAWMTPDPLDYVDGGNRYEGFGNNGIRYTDPNGLWKQEADGSFVVESGDTPYKIATDIFGRNANWRDVFPELDDPTKLQLGVYYWSPSPPSWILPATQPSTQPHPPATQPTPPKKPVDDLWFSVLATREGLVGGKTATGHIIDKCDIFVALPSRKALNKKVIVRYRGKDITAPVLDVGPHSTDDAYWENKDNAKPKAETGQRTASLMQKHGPPKNQAGIDLSDGLWDSFGIDRKLGIVGVQWRFE